MSKNRRPAVRLVTRDVIGGGPCSDKRIRPARTPLAAHKKVPVPGAAHSVPEAAESPLTPCR